MKRNRNVTSKFKKNLLMFSLAGIFTVAMAGFAAAECSLFIVGTSADGKTTLDCDLVADNGSSCDYTCTCVGDLGSCINMLLNN